MKLFETITSGTNQLAQKLSPVVYYAIVYGVPVALVLLVVILWRRKAANKALQYVGQLETGYNGGFQNATFQKEISELAGWRSGRAWCAAFVKMIFMKAYPGKSEEIDNILTLSAVESYQKAAKDETGTFYVSDKPKPGCIVTWQNYSGGVPSATGHTGIVTKVHSDTFETVEGNTSGKVEGQKVEGVFKKTHNFKKEWVVNNGLRLKGFIILK